VDALASKCPYCLVTLELNGSNPLDPLLGLWNALGAFFILWILLAIVAPTWAAAIWSGMEWFFHMLRLFFDGLGAFIDWVAAKYF
jgi:hypothetical protein